eukprot:TRINITY_DN527_c0_g1_i15.p2 TRINITY_DN527_c0_g1~~TRINITY_DN527_c0_g1_i15.p2  ORF type:complete len:167 (-),score=33.94 TRINITY_DN527_c0_g1_i15:126-626(-)
MCIRDRLDEDLMLRSLDIHPDGLLVGFGASDGTVRIWGVNEGYQVAVLPATGGVVKEIAFSQNGVHFASISENENVVRIWDLRNQENIKVLLQDENDTQLSSLTFDSSGQYLAVGGSKLYMFNTKQWDIFSRVQSHSDRITSLSFGKESKNYASVSLDRHLVVYSS